MLGMSRICYCSH